MSFRYSGQTAFGQKTMSVYGGAGGTDTRISIGKLNYLQRVGVLNIKDLDLHVDANEKAMLQNLNNRLATYLEKVHLKQKENQRLEKQIAEWYSSRSVISPDYSAYTATIEDLRNKIQEATLVNSRIKLEIDNSKLAADDLKMKYETELNMRQTVEGEIGGLRRFVDLFTMYKMDLESQCESLKEDLISMKSNNEEHLADLRKKISGQLEVVIDGGSEVDLNQIITEIRNDYEGVIKKNRKDLEQWYQNKLAEVKKGVEEQTTNLQTFQAEIKELRNTLQKYQIELESQLSMKSSLEASLLEIQQRYSAQLSGLQNVVTGLEAQLTSLSKNMRENEQKYGTLLDIKTRLEMEISEYRRLLDGEDGSLSSKKVITKTTVVEETYVDGVKVESK